MSLVSMKVLIFTKNYRRISVGPLSVLKYRKDTDLRFSEKIAKFGAHSAKKKLNRLTQKMVGVVVSPSTLY